MKWRLLIFTAVVSCAGLLLLPVVLASRTATVVAAATPTEGVYAAFDGKTYSTCATATPVPTPTPRPTYTPQPTYTPPPATLAQIPKTGWSVTYVDSEEPGDWASQVFDGSPWTNWHTAWSGSAPPHPHLLIIDFGAAYGPIVQLDYTPKQADANGHVAGFILDFSSDGFSWATAATGFLPDTTATVPISVWPTTARYMRLTATSEVNGGPWTAVGELTVYVSVAAGATPTMVPTPTMLPTATVPPTETPYYAVGKHYLGQDVWLNDGAGQVFLLRLDAHSTVPGPGADRTTHRFDVTVTNYSGEDTLLPLSGFLFIRDIDQSGDTVRGQWRGDDAGLEHLGLPAAVPLEESVFAAGATRSYPIAVIAPTGTVTELGVTTGWQREFVDPAGLQGAVPVWIVLQPDPVTCPHGQADPIPPLPTPAVYGDIYAGVPGGDGTPGPGGDSAVWPLAGSLVRGFGCQPHFTGIDGTPYGCPPAAPWWHNGIDLAAAHGTGIVAPMAGSITFAGADSFVDCSAMDGSDPPHFGYGNYQQLTAGGYLHVLAHQSGFAITSGIVNQGQVVGYEGSTGCSTGPHLHWGVATGGAYIDPALLVP